MALLAVTLATPSLNVFRSGDDNVLQWTVSNTKLDSFRIEKKVDAGAWGTLTTKAAGDRSHTDASVTTPATYTYRVVSIRGGRERTSNEAQVVVGGGAESLLSFSDLTWVGSFKGLAAHGGYGISYNPANHSLFLLDDVTQRKVLEQGIPALVQSTTYSALNSAPIVQNRVVLNPPNWDNLTSPNNNPLFYGSHVWNGDVIITAFAQYDASYVATHSHMRIVGGATNLAGTQEGFFQLGTATPQNGVLTPSFLAGGMTTIPAAHQASFGNMPLITGISGGSIIQRTSVGPTAFGFNPNDLNASTPAPLANMVHYPWTSDLSKCITNINVVNSTWLQRTGFIGSVWPEGWDSLMFFGAHGYGEGNTFSPGLTYGVGTANSALAGEAVPGEPGWFYRYDPCDLTHGYHAWPYRSQLWSYRASDLKNVYDGVVNPWSIQPYEITPFDMPLTHCLGTIRGVAHNPADRLIYLTTGSIEAGGLCACHAYQYPAAV